ncbi:hypothetical protein [Sphingomonas sp. Leaf231]|uniref:hypothetical protein n=1 Tax=Sphingomonas sp. Leaf231 TaxID=1736301 RepID=UPI0012E1C2EE|nr:hypothetical protein [Sphingomonas sp. Leaf231]
MVDSGVLLVRSNCNDFFRQMGSIQRGSQISRDLITPIIAVLSGVVALKGFSGARSDRYLQGLSLGSTAALAGIDVVDRHFLFGAENIHSVRQLTFRALDAHRRGLLQSHLSSFENSVMYLIDHQVICTPASILDLTKRAIAAGEVAPRKDQSVVDTDDKALRMLGMELGLPGPASPDQAGALYWLFKGNPTADDLANIANKLGSNSVAVLSKDPVTLANAPLPSTDSKRKAILEALNELSVETRGLFSADILKPVDKRPPEFTLAPSLSSRVELDVR